MHKAGFHAIILSACLLTSSLARAQPVQTVQSLGPYHLTPLSLRRGVTQVPDFTPDGETGTVFLAYRDNGNAHGYYAYMFSVDGNLVGIYEKPGLGGPLNDLIYASPFEGENVYSVVELVRGQIGGRKGIFLIKSVRDIPIGATMVDSVPVMITIYALQTHILDQIGVGSTDDAFVPFATLRSTACYVNAFVGLNGTLKIGNKTPSYPDLTKDEAQAEPCWQH